LPQNISGSGVAFPPNVRAPTDSDPANTSQLAVAFGDVADRTANLKSRLDALNGVVSLRRVANDAALLALTAHNDGDVCLVDLFGFYEYVAALTMAPMAPWIRTPTNVGSGAGRWVLMPAGALGGPNGLSQLDANARVPAASVRNGIVNTGFVLTSGTPGTTLQFVQSATDVDVAGTTITMVGTMPGDQVFVTASASIGTMSGNEGRVSLTVLDGSATVNVQQLDVAAVNNQVNVAYALTGLYAVQSPGSLTVKLRAARVSGSGSLVFAHQCSVFALAMRP